MEPSPPAPEDLDIDTERPTLARAYDYLLGGEHNFASDREMIRQAMDFMPDLPIQAQANRAFLHRAVSFLADAGIRQFLDIGSGIPTRGNVHEVAQKAAPDAKVVYVDIDPVAVSHSRQLLADNPNTVVIQEDARNTKAIIEHPDVRARIDFDQPLAVIMVALLHVISDADDPYAIVATMRSVMAPGSYLVIGHGTSDGLPAEAARMKELTRRTPTTLHTRDRASVLRLFDGFELIEPGLVWVPEWRPESPDDVPANPERSTNYGGVGRLVASPGDRSAAA
jgi:SAM-dependent methyltransferase